MGQIEAELVVIVADGLMASHDAFSLPMILTCGIDVPLMCC
jgi:hypothetical protein